MINYIKNLPEYAKEMSYIVASKGDDGLWFYGAYDDAFDAFAAKKEIDGVIVNNT